MVSQDKLKSILRYEPETGKFYWLEARGRVSEGSEAGSVGRFDYLVIKIDGRAYYAHRLAHLYMKGCFPDEDIDHENGKRRDNRWENLRPVSRSENHMNRGITSSNKSGCIGVFWNTGKKKWTARIKVRGKDRHLGHFSSFEDAVFARREAEKEEGFHCNHGKRKAFEGGCYG